MLGQSSEEDGGAVVLSSCSSGWDRQCLYGPFTGNTCLL